MEKLDIEKLGEYITEWKDGKPWTGGLDGLVAARQCAKKINEIIDEIKTLKDK